MLVERRRHTASLTLQELLGLEHSGFALDVFVPSLVLFEAGLHYCNYPGLQIVLSETNETSRNDLVQADQSYRSYLVEVLEQPRQCIASVLDARKRPSPTDNGDGCSWPKSYTPKFPDPADAPIPAPLDLASKVVHCNAKVHLPN